METQRCYSDERMNEREKKEKKIDTSHAGEGLTSAPKAAYASSREGIAKDGRDGAPLSQEGRTRPGPQRKVTETEMNHAEMKGEVR